ncbi:hypothetical protein Aduo_019018 [Ancylostoma duodenale]
MASSTARTMKGRTIAVDLSVLVPLLSKSAPFCQIGGESFWIVVSGSCTDVYVSGDEYGGHLRPLVVIATVLLAVNTWLVSRCCHGRRSANGVVGLISHIPLESDGLAAPNAPVMKEIPL